MPVRIAVSAMRTRFELVLDGGDEASLRAAGEEALDEIRRTEAELSRFRRDSYLAHVVREAARRPVRLPADLFDLLERCVAVHAASDGAFDLTVAPLLQRYGLEGPRPPTGPGDPAHVVSDRAPGMGAIQLDPVERSVRFTAADVTLDLGGVAKGFALDRAAVVLREAGVTRALLHGGTSTVVAIGAPPDRACWAVTLRDPLAVPAHDSGPGPDRERPLATVRLRDQALSVSAPHGKVSNGAGHLMDPRQGRPVCETLLAAVVHEHATEADAWSTAIAVLGASAQSHLPHLVVAADGDLQLISDRDGHFEVVAAELATRFTSQPAVAHEF